MPAARYSDCIVCIPKCYIVRQITATEAKASPLLGCLHPITILSHLSSGAMREKKDLVTYYALLYAVLVHSNDSYERSLLQRKAVRWLYCFRKICFLLFLPAWKLAFNRSVYSSICYTHSITFPHTITPIYPMEWPFPSPNIETLLADRKLGCMPTLSRDTVV